MILNELDLAVYIAAGRWQGVIDAMIVVIVGFKRTVKGVNVGYR